MSSGSRSTLGGLRHLQVEVPATVVSGGEAELAHVAAEQGMLVSRFRTLVIVVVVVFLVVINASVLVLLRGAAMILQPVECLTEAARHLNEDRFDYRLEWDRKDEFGELARLQQPGRAVTDQRTWETGNPGPSGARPEPRPEQCDFRHRAPAATAEPQDQWRARRGAIRPGIRDGLARMASTVESLKHVRRIVLTDYVSGVKMLDLERSVLAGSRTPGAVAKGGGGPGRDGRRGRT